jgi:N-acetylneuraminic acid mutarotase
VETSLPEPRYAHAAATVDDAVYVVGGKNDQQQTVDTLFEYRDGTWTTKMPQPGGGRAYGNAVRLGSGFVSVGGLLDNGPLTSITDLYISATDSWAVGASLPTGGRHGAAGLEVDLDTVIVGGSRGTGVLLNESIRLNGNTWISGPPLPNPPRYNLSGAGTGGNGHVAGGINANLQPLNHHHTLRDSTWTARTALLEPSRYLNSACTTR